MTWTVAVGASIRKESVLPAFAKLPVLGFVITRPPVAMMNGSSGGKCPPTAVCEASERLFS